MPTCRRKRVVLTEPSEALLQAVRTDPTKPVFYVRQTGELFETYEYDPPSLPLVHSDPYSVSFAGLTLRACHFTE